MKQKRSLFLVLATVALVAAIWSFLWLAGPKQQTLDQRVQQVGAQLKCPVCQNESVADSPSTLAQQMRFIIRQQLQEGKSEQEVIQYFVKSYGGQIIWSPPWQGFTLLIWLVPIGLLLGGVVLLFFVLREWRRGAPTKERSGTKQGQKANSGVAAENNKAEQSQDAELERYRVLLEEELAADDVLFTRPGTEVP